MDDFYDDASYTWCGGEAWTECDDPIQCCSTHTPGGLCPCSACNGTGLAKHQWVW